MRKLFLAIAISIATFSQAQQPAKDTVILSPITDSLRVDAIEVLEILKKQNIGVNDYAQYEKAYIILLQYSAEKRKRVQKSPIKKP